MNDIKYNIIHCFKIFNQYLLSFLLVFTGLNLDEHTHHFDEGYGICNQGCDSAEHHSMHNECEDCINNSSKQKFFINVQTKSTFNSSCLSCLSESRVKIVFSIEVRSLAYPILSKL